MKQTMSTSLALPPILDITAAGPLASEFLRVRGKDVSVDASKVERVGAQCIQVLLSAVATWTLDGMEFDLANPSAALVDSFDTVGLEPATFIARNA